jgi:Cu/Ag efflux protein CusF
MTTDHRLFFIKSGVQFLVKSFIREASMIKRIVILAMMMGLLVVCAYAQTAKKEHVFSGKIEKIDVAAKTFTVNGEKVEGWMDKMTMVYVPDKEDVLKKVKVGDQITAKVFDGDFRTLHDVQVVPPKPADAAKDAKKDSKAPAKK